MFSGDELYDDDVTSGPATDERTGSLILSSGSCYHCGRTDLHEATCVWNTNSIRSTRQAWPTPTDDEPDLETIEEWDADGGCDATDGCWVEPDGICQHGHPSWMLRLGLI